MSATSEPAAPKGETVALRPTYQPSATRPMLNSSAVTTPPTHTSRQAIFTSGTSLKISANRSDVTARLTSTFNASQSTGSSIAPSKKPLMVASAALTTSETSNKNATPITIEK